MVSTTYQQLSNSIFLASLFGALASATPTPSTNIKPRYQPGACALHLTQYQKAVPGVDPYQVQVNVFDAIHDEIGSSPVLPANPVADIDSQLPYVIIVTVGSADSDPVGFQYAGQTWTSDNSQCSTGNYDGGSRQMDCGFTC